MYLLKISVLGGKNVGKKTIAKSRFLEKLFDSDNMSTTGVDFSSKTLIFNDIEARLQLFLYNPDKRFWDRNKLINLERVIPGSHGAVIMYDITKSNSLEQIPQWVQIIKNNTRDIPILLAGNKLDLKEQREISKEQIETIKNEYNIASALEISAKTGENVEKLFSNLTNLIINHIREISELDEKRDSFVRLINSAIRTEKMKLEGKNRLKKQRKIWRKHYAEGTETFEAFLKKQKERIIKLEEMRNSLINAKELADLLKVWKKAKILLNI